MLLSQKFYPEKRLIMSESIGIYIHIPFANALTAIFSAEEHLKRIMIITCVF